MNDDNKPPVLFTNPLGNATPATDKEILSQPCVKEAIRKAVNKAIDDNQRDEFYGFLDRESGRSLV
jgi:hypothetical protein